MEIHNPIDNVIKSLNIWSIRCRGSLARKGAGLENRWFHTSGVQTIPWSESGNIRNKRQGWARTRNGTCNNLHFSFSVRRKVRSTFQGILQRTMANAISKLSDKVRPCARDVENLLLGALFFLLLKPRQGETSLVENCKAD